MNRPHGERTGGRKGGLFLTCADINKQEMRKIIIISDRKTQRRTLMKKLNIHFRSKDELARRGQSKKAKLAIDDFLPVGLNGEVVEETPSEQRNVGSLEGEHPPCGAPKGVTSHSDRRECDSCDVYSINLMRRKKMKKIIKDLFYNTLTYCISKNISVVEISTFLSIFKHIFFKLVNGGGHVVDLFAEFKKVMLQHSVNRSPSCVKIFSYSSLRLLMKYALNTFFRNFFFYKFIFVPIYDTHFAGGVDHLEGVDDFGRLETDDEVGFDEEAAVCSLDTPSGGDYVRRLLTLHVGEINHLTFGKSSEDAFEREMQDRFSRFEIQKEPITFETNKCKENKNLKKLCKRVESGGQVDGKGKKGKEKWSASEGYLIGKMDSLYRDLEARMVKRLDGYLG
ncbi:CLAMP domain-containing protein, putative [Plasmodium vivax]|uniref:CLAMP domain-containing protein, putative n=1 Tax=Plasmodium vivax TaxID=5855 RepID=A0A1G4GZH3_PLAVI|nr:CLAMP domain-containing protein, putative [Plasmodium vivax]SCO67951.1 conserved Plasmodium protein, unknown function [Plasmodium vivax]VUZ96790.1 CLAMP domain-containing protein, putative [Plasmodium vivax]